MDNIENFLFMAIVLIIITIFLLLLIFALSILITHGIYRFFNIQNLNKIDVCICTLLGGVYGLFVHISIYLSIATCSHQQSYSLYGFRFAEFYHEKTLIIMTFIYIVLLIGVIISKFIKPKNKHKYQKIIERIWCIGSSYQVVFVLLFFLPASLFVSVFDIPYVLNIGYSWFIYENNIEDVNAVYRLSSDIYNADLSFSSLTNQVTYVFSNAGLIVCYVGIDYLIQIMQKYATKSNLD